jgi:hypothetical protein
VNLFHALADSTSFLFASSVHRSVGRSVQTVTNFVAPLQAIVATLAVGLTSLVEQSHALTSLVGVRADLAGMTSGNPELDLIQEEALNEDSALKEHDATIELSTSATTAVSKSAKGNARGPSGSSWTKTSVEADASSVLKLCDAPNASDAMRGVGATELPKPTRPSAATVALVGCLMHAHPAVRVSALQAVRCAVKSSNGSQVSLTLLHALWRLVRSWAAEDHAVSGLVGTALGARPGTLASSHHAVALAMPIAPEREGCSGWDAGVGVSGESVPPPPPSRGSAGRVFRSRPRPQWVATAISAILDARESSWKSHDVAVAWAVLVVLAHSPYVSTGKPAVARHLLAVAHARLIAASGASPKSVASLASLAAGECLNVAADAATLAASPAFSLRLAQPATAVAAATSGAWAAVDVLASRPDAAAALVRHLTGRAGLLSVVPALRVGAQATLASLMAGLPAPTMSDKSAEPAFVRSGSVGRALVVSCIVPWARSVLAQACRAPITPLELGAWKECQSVESALGAEHTALQALVDSGEELLARRPVALWDEPYRESWKRRETSWILVEHGLAMTGVSDVPKGDASFLPWSDEDDRDRLECFTLHSPPAGKHSQVDWVASGSVRSSGLEDASSLAVPGAVPNAAPRDASVAESEGAIRSGALVLRGPGNKSIPAGAFSEATKLALESRRIGRIVRRLDLRAFRAAASLEALTSVLLDVAAPHVGFASPASFLSSWASRCAPGAETRQAQLTASCVSPLIAGELGLSLSSPLAKDHAVRATVASVRAACRAAAETVVLGDAIAVDFAAALAAVAEVEALAQSAVRPSVVLGFGTGSGGSIAVAAAGSSSKSEPSKGGLMGLDLGGSSSRKVASSPKPVAEVVASRAHSALMSAGLPIRIRPAPGVSAPNGREIVMSGARGRRMGRFAGLLRRLFFGLCNSLDIHVTLPGARSAAPTVSAYPKVPESTSARTLALRLPPQMASLLSFVIRAASCSFPPPAFLPAALALLAAHSAPIQSDVTVATAFERMAMSTSSPTDATCVPLGPSLVAVTPSPGRGASASFAHTRASADAWASIAASYSSPRPAKAASVKEEASTAATPAAAAAPPPPAPEAVLPDTLAVIPSSRASLAAATSAAGIARLLALRLARPALLDAALSLVRVAPRATPSPIGVVRCIVAPPSTTSSAIASAESLNAQDEEKRSILATPKHRAASDHPGEEEEEQRDEMLVDGSHEASVPAWSAAVPGQAAVASLADAWSLLGDAGSLSLTPDVRWASLRALRSIAQTWFPDGSPAGAADLSTCVNEGHGLVMSAVMGVGGGESGSVLLPSRLIAMSRNALPVTVDGSTIPPPQPCVQRRAVRWMDEKSAAQRALHARLWLLAHDSDEVGIGAAADSVCEEVGVAPSPAMAAAMLAMLSHPSEATRAAAARGMASVCEESEDDSLTAQVLRSVFALYRRSGGDAPLVGATSSEAMAAFPSDVVARALLEADEEEAAAVEAGTASGAAKWMARDGCMRALQEVAACGAIPVTSAVYVLEHIISRGLADRMETVRMSALAAGEAVVEAHGEARTKEIMVVIESVLEEGERSHLAAGSEVRRDLQREGCVVLLGAAARHLSPTDAKVRSTVTTLLETLNTPSEPVQKAVSACLPPLAKVLKSESGRIIARLVETITRGDSFAVRRGAAFGLAGCIKGFGLGTLKAHDVMTSLEGAAQDKRRAQAREGAMFAFEQLCIALGILFEPYIIRVLPLLLTCYGDTEKEVRVAAAAASRAVMQRLSAHGVKLVMPSLLDALGQSQWRTKQAAIKMLGATAYCAPKQLGACLPQVVPALLEAFVDTHPKVRAASHSALASVGSVVRNPEISAISPQLLDALSDPVEKTAIALEALASTSFVHAIDPPSLALVMPVLRRGLRSGSADVKQTACAIAGSMTSLVGDSSILVPYLPELLPLLKATLIDPIPDVRAVAARALGSTVKGVGIDEVGDLFEWLKKTTVSPSSSVERSGGAQGLCEVSAAVGDACVEETVEFLLPKAKESLPASREGVYWFLAFLPPVLGDKFTPWLRRLFGIVVAGLADDVEQVRDVALRAGQVIVRLYGLSATSLVVPTLEAGLMHANWRIRQCSIRLTTDLAHRAAGAEGSDLDKLGNAVSRADAGDETDEFVDSDAEEEEDDEAAAAPARTAAAPVGKSEFWDRGSRIVAVLTKTSHDSLMAGLYMLRSDSSAVVRQAAYHAWKAMCQYTPGLLREVLPALMERTVLLLAADDIDNRNLGVRSLGELTRRMGESIIVDMVPVMQAGLDPSRDEIHREGVCMGLTEMLGGVQRRQLDGLLDVVSPAVRQALCDPSERVRAAAGRAFNAFQRVVGQRSVDEIVHPLLKELDSDDEALSMRAMLGLRGVLALRGNEILPMLIPRLTKSPMSLFQVRTIAAVAEVTSTIISSFAFEIVPALVRALADEEEPIATGTKAASLVSRWMGPEGPPPGVLVGAAKTGSQMPSDEAKGDLFLGNPDAVNSRLHSEMLTAAGRFMAAIPEVSLSFVVEPALKFVSGSRSPYRRWAACALLRSMLSQTKEPLSDVANLIVREIVYRFDDPHPCVVIEAAEAMATLLTVADRDAIVSEMRFVRDSLKSAQSDAKLRRGLLVRTSAPVAASSGAGASASASASKAPPSLESATAAALAALAPALPKDLPPQVEAVVTAMTASKTAAADMFRLPGLCIPTAILPLHEVFVYAIHNGPVESKQAGVEAVAEIVQMAGDEALEPHLKKMAGPLLRVLTESFPPHVRIATIHALGCIIDRMPEAVKGLVSSMQISFAKLLTDLDASLRQAAAEGMALLARYLPKVDYAAKELCRKADKDAPGIRESRLYAIDLTCRASAHRMAPASLAGLMEIIEPGLSDDDALFRSYSNHALASCLAWIPREEANRFVDATIRTVLAGPPVDTSGDWRLYRSAVRQISSFWILGSFAPAVFDRAKEITVALGKAVTAPQHEIRCDACVALMAMLMAASASHVTATAESRSRGTSSVGSVEAFASMVEGSVAALKGLPSKTAAAALASLAKDSDREVRECAANAIRRVARLVPSSVEANLAVLGPVTLDLAKDGAGTVRKTGEFACLYVFRPHTDGSRIISSLGGAAAAAANVEMLRKIGLRLSPESDDLADEKFDF